MLTWLLDKLWGPASRRLRHPDLAVERVEHAGYHMVDATKVSVNVVLTVRNVGQATAESYRAQARVRRDDGVRLELRDPRNPGDAVFRRENGDDIIEWQSTEAWPSSFTRKIEWRLHLRQGARALVALTLTAPYMKPVSREVEVTWPASQPQIRVLSP